MTKPDTDLTCQEAIELSRRAMKKAAVLKEKSVAIQMRSYLLKRQQAAIIEQAKGL